MAVYLRRKIKLKCILLMVCLIGIVYTIYQIRSVQELTNKTLSKRISVRGVHSAYFKFYYPGDNEKFTCIGDKTQINYDRVNDNYCDCEDGSDEPGTEACPNGKFYCTYDIYNKHATPLPSGRVNDGICDCCDGSDEWRRNRPPVIVTSPCTNVC